MSHALRVNHPLQARCCRGSTCGEAAAAAAERGPGRERRQPRRTERRGLGRGPSLPRRPLGPRPEPPDASGRSPSLCPPRAGPAGRSRRGSLTGPWRAAQRPGQAAGAPPAALQQHGGHGGARWTGRAAPAPLLSRRPGRGDPPHAQAAPREPRWAGTAPQRRARREP